MKMNAELSEKQDWGLYWEQATEPEPVRSPLKH